MNKWYGKERLAEIDALLMDKMELVTQFVRDEAKRRSPIDTGNLRSSITNEVKKEAGEIVGQVGTNVDYAIHQEFGTKHQSGKPFLRPAIQENKEQIKKILA